MNTRIAAVVLALSSVILPVAAHAQSAPMYAPEGPPPAMGDEAQAVAPPMPDGERMVAPDARGGRFEDPGRSGHHGHHGHRRFEAREGFDGRAAGPWMEGRGFEGRGGFEGRHGRGMERGEEGGACAHERGAEGRGGFEGRHHGWGMERRGGFEGRGFEGRGEGRPMEGRGFEGRWNGRGE